MSNNKAFRSALYLSMMVSLAACGGGGSSSGNNSSGGKLMLDSGGYAERKVSIGKQSDVSAALEIYETSLAISELMWDVEREIDTWGDPEENGNRKSTRLNSSHVKISYAVFCLEKKKKNVQ